MNNVKQHLELIRTYLPKYLSPEAQENLFKDISENFPYSKNPDKLYIRLDDQDKYYQGDGLIDIPFANLDLKKKKFNTHYYQAVILSNSCDINPEHARLDIPYILFAVIIPLNEYLEELKLKNIDKNRIDSFLNNLRDNKISNLFYLPELKYNNEEIILQESFIRFDFNGSHLSSFILSDNYDKRYKPEGDRIFTFSNYGFYLFIFKLSIHFTRFREGAFRN